MLATFDALTRAIHTAVERAYATAEPQTVTHEPRGLVVYSSRELAVLREHENTGPIPVPSLYTPILTAYPDGRFDGYPFALPREVVHV